MTLTKYDNTIERITLDEETIGKRVKELGLEISREFEGESLFVMCVLKGSVIFLADLTRAISIPLEYGFVTISTYKGGTSPKKKPEINVNALPNLEGKNILLVEDILDSGNTIKETHAWVKKQNPASIKVAVCVAKEGYENCAYPNPDYIGFIIPNEFIVGYGLDYQEIFRNLPYIGILKPWVYQPEDTSEEIKS